MTIEQAIATLLAIPDVTQADVDFTITAKPNQKSSIEWTVAVWQGDNETLSQEWAPTLEAAVSVLRGKLESKGSVADFQQLQSQLAGLQL